MKILSFASLSILILLSTDSPAAAQAAKPGSTGRPTVTTQTPTGTSSTAPAPRPTGSTGTATSTTGVTGTASRPADSSTATDYRLGAGDKLRIDVYKDAQLSQSLQIRPDGKITLPLLGDVAASGRTPTELRDSIAQSLKQYITEPVVTVIVVETVPQTIYVMGEVNKPGPQPLSAQMTVLQALATAEGFKDFAKTKEITILRKSARGSETIPFNYKDAIKGKGPTVNLQPGDTIIVP